MAADISHEELDLLKLLFSFGAMDVRVALPRLLGRTDRRLPPELILDIDIPSVPLLMALGNERLVSFNGELTVAIPHWEAQEPTRENRAALEQLCVQRHVLNLKDQNRQLSAQNAHTVRHEQFHSLQVAAFCADAVLQPSLAIPMTHHKWYGYGPELGELIQNLEGAQAFQNRTRYITLQHQGGQIIGFPLVNFLYREVQAQFFPLMVEGYKTWGCLPTDRLELCAALSGLGLPIPVAMRKRLDAHPEVEKKFRSFPTSEHFPEDKRQFLLNIITDGPRLLGLRVAEKDVQSKWVEPLFDRVIPAMYDDLLKLCGDTKDRSVELGVKPAPVYARAFVQALLQKDFKMTPDQWERLSKKVEPDHLAAVAITCVDHLQEERAQVALTAMFKHRKAEVFAATLPWDKRTTVSIYADQKPATLKAMYACLPTIPARRPSKSSPSNSTPPSVLPHL